MTKIEPTPARKKLIEVSIPLEVINRESAREKSIRHGHPSTLHLWWARRPLAACRAVLFAQLVDDPSACPEEFPTKAEQDAERDRLHKLIAALVPWEASNDETILNEARYEIARSIARGRGDKLTPIGQMKPRQIIDYIQANAPPVYDPFCGGGSIPLEAQRLGLAAIGSDLNPVAVLIAKALVEFPPKFAGRKPINPQVNELHQWKGAEGLADDVRHYGHWILDQAEKKIGNLYPKVRLKGGAEATVIAWLWARTLPSPDPRAKGVYVPLVSTFVLCAKAGKEVIVRPVVDRSEMEWHFEIDDKPSKADLEAAREGTVSRKGAICILTGTPIPFTCLRDYAKKHALLPKLMAIVAEGPKGRVYLSPTAEHERIAAAPNPADTSAIEQYISHWPGRTNIVEYGMERFDKVFSSRQLTGLTTFSDLVMEARARVLVDAAKYWSGASADDTRRLFEHGLGPAAYADAVSVYLAMSVDRLAMTGNTLVRWNNIGEKAQHAFGRQALPMIWDFAEPNFFAEATGSVSAAVAMSANGIRFCGTGSGEIRVADAAKLGELTNVIVSTDPPYYDNVGYADLADFFYVWLRRSIAAIFPMVFRRALTPKAEELVAKPYREYVVPEILPHVWDKLKPKERAEAFFMFGMKRALATVATSLNEFPITIYYAFKEAGAAKDDLEPSGWAAFLQAVTDAGLAIDGTWPLRTEMATRMVAADANALASSIVLVCRRRGGSASTATRADFLRARNWKQKLSP